MILQRLDESARSRGFDKVAAAVGTPHGMAGNPRTLIQELHAPDEAVGRHCPKTRHFRDLHRTLIGREPAHAVIVCGVHVVVFLRARGWALS